MPGSGKSTVGVLLAKALGYSFVDVDLIICKEAGKPLQKILDNEGLDFFLYLEGKIGAELDYDKTVIATGGSMVLSENAMENLRKNGKVVFIFWKMYALICKRGRGQFIGAADICRDRLRQTAHTGIKPLSYRPR